MQKGLPGLERLPPEERGTGHGSGTNEPCAVCDQAITASETEYEVAGPVMIVRVHVACYHAWSGESQRSA
jgi:hypothetical protein